MSDDVRGSPIGDARYPIAARDLARFTPDPVDEAIRTVIEGTRDLGREQLKALRHELDTDDLYTLLTFARRQAAQALRDDDLAIVARAIDALTLVTRSKIDYRDLSVDFPLFAVRELGGDLTSTIDRAVARSEPGTADAFEAARERAPELTLAGCALVSVSTSHGVGFIDDWTGTRSPPTDLANATVTLADLIDGEGSYLVRDMTVTQLPEVWLSTERSVGDVATSGCVRLGANHVSTTHRYSHSLLVFVAEMPSARRASDLATAAASASSEDRPTSAINIGPYLALFVGGSTTRGEAPLETVASLARFHPMALAALPPPDGIRAVGFGR